MAAMAIILVKDGTDRLTKPILDYLLETYGMRPEEVRAVHLDSVVGQALALSVDLTVRAPEPEPGPAPDGRPEGARPYDAPTGFLDLPRRDPGAAL